MSSSAQQPTWRRIYLQTITLTHKNLLIFFKSPTVTFVRAFLFPLAVTLIFSFLVHLNTTSSWSSNDYGISKVSYPLRSLADAIHTSPSRKLVFIKNGFSNETLDPIIEGVLREPGLEDVDSIVSDDPNALFDICKQSTTGASDCFAAIIFTALNETNVDYSIAIDSSIGDSYGYWDYRKDDTLLPGRIFPLQWAVDAQIGNFSTAPRPSTQAFSGYFGAINNETPAEPDTNGPYWLSLVTIFVAPIFILILIGVVYRKSSLIKPI